MTAASAAATVAPGKRLSKRSLVAYGQIALPLAIADLPLVIYLAAFFGTDIGVSLQAMSWVLLVSRLFDLAIDPAIGIASDRSSRWTVGRRKSWVLLGIPLKMLGIYMIFFAEPGAGAVYMLVWLMVLYLGWTMIQIPYGAWGAELSDDYTERSRITGWRAFFLFAGILAASLAPLFTGGGIGTKEGLTPVMQGLGLWAMILFPISGLLIWLFVPDKPPRQAGAEITWGQGMRIAARNKPFMRILIATTIGRVGAAINSAVVPFFFFFVMQLGAESGLPLIVWLVCAALAVPLWVALGERFSKHNALIVAVVSSVVTFGLLLFVPPGNLELTCLVMALAGIGGGAAATLGLSIAADVIDLDELKARKSRAGLLIAFWNMGAKLADALGGFIALQLLAFYGFNAMSLVNTPEAIWGLTLTYIIIPWPFYLASVVLLWKFPLTRERQARIRRMIERRAARLAPAE